MSAPVLSIIILAMMFLLATVLPLNMGALAFVGAFLLGSVVLGMSTNDILANFPGGLFLTIVGVTYLFAIAQNNGTIDLLVSNVQMPNMTGPDLAKSLRQGRPGLRVLLISGYPQGLLMLDTGWWFLQKPFPPKAIIDKIHEVIAVPPRPWSHEG